MGKTNQIMTYFPKMKIPKFRGNASIYVVVVAFLLLQCCMDSKLFSSIIRFSDGTSLRLFIYKVTESLMYNSLFRRICIFPIILTRIWLIKLIEIKARKYSNIHLWLLVALSSIQPKIICQLPIRACWFYKWVSGL